MGCQVLTLLYYRYTSIFWEHSRSNQTETITQGPEAGLLVSLEKQTMYSMYYEDTQEYLSEDDNVLFLSEKTWLYLCGNYSNSSMSAWLTERPEQSIDRLSTYYAINPEKTPNVVFVDRDHTNCESYCVENGYTLAHISKYGNKIYRKSNQ